jgi:hypothetical protein
MGLTAVLQAVDGVALKQAVDAWVSAPEAIGYLAGLTGLAYLGQAFVVGNEGFSPNGTVVSLLALALEPVWIVWLFVAASRKAVCPCLGCACAYGVRARRPG